MSPYRMRVCLPAPVRANTANQRDDLSRSWTRSTRCGPLRSRLNAPHDVQLDRSRARLVASSEGELGEVVSADDGVWGGGAGACVVEGRRARVEALRLGKPPLLLSQEPERVQSARKQRTQARRHLCALARLRLGGEAARIELLRCPLEQVRCGAEVALRPKHRRQLRHPQRNLGMRLSHQPPPRQYRALEQTARLLQSIAHGSAAAVRKAATGHTVLATPAASSAAAADCAVCAPHARPAPASQLSIFLSRTLRRRLCGDGRVPKEEGQVAGDRGGALVLCADRTAVKRQRLAVERRRALSFAERAVYER
mmetsp:Transcript_6023/g.19344  ORF Transcript_6023/g.19344 Transcript_6023/m.19344 type:complete len:311 (-) Transcript_6023:374-1306(-)